MPFTYKEPVDPDRKLSKLAWIKILGFILVCARQTYMNVGPHSREEILCTSKVTLEELEALGDIRGGVFLGLVDVH